MTLVGMDAVRQNCCCPILSRSLAIRSPELCCGALCFAGGASCRILASSSPGSLAAVQLSCMFPPPTAGPFPLDGRFDLNPAVFCWYPELFMSDEEAGFGCGEGEKSGIKHFVHQLMPHPVVPATR